MTRTTSERIGIFGGTFNPIHYGHLRAAEEIREHFSLSTVIFVPARIPPHKDGDSITSPEHRLRMIQLAIKENASFASSDFELAREQTSYSIVTLEHFYRQHSPSTELYFLLGMDSFLEITTWKDYTRLFSLSNLVVMARPGFPQRAPEAVLPFDVVKNFDYNPNRRLFKHVSGHRLYFQQISLLEISSSDIRVRIRNQQSVRYLVPEPVEEYIGKNGLFKG